MELKEIEELALDLLGDHHLDALGWTFRWDNAKARGGYCSYSKRTISMSRLLAPKWPEAEVRNTLLHEIAHALAGSKAGHGPVWRKQALAIGCDASRTHSNETAPAPWVGSCPGGHEHKRYRRPTRTVSCATCSPKFSMAYAITWTRVDAPVVQVPARNIAVNEVPTGWLPTY